MQERKAELQRAMSLLIIEKYSRSSLNSRFAKSNF